MTKFMLKGKGLPHCFWGEAVTTAAYVLNRCPTKIVTLEEPWSRDKPMVHHFRIFGSVCYRHIPDEKRIISRDVIVDGAGSWNWVNETQTHVSYFLEDSVKILGNSTIEVSTVRRSEIVRFPSTRLVNHEQFSDSIVSDSGWLFLLILNQSVGSKLLILENGRKL